MYVYVLTAFARKFGQAGFFTIYQDYAIHSLGLTLTESGIGGTVYGCTAIGAVVLVMISHAIKLQYSKLISLIVGAGLNGVSIILITAAVGQVRRIF